MWCANSGPLRKVSDCLLDESKRLGIERIAFAFSAAVLSASLAALVDEVCESRTAISEPFTLAPGKISVLRRDGAVAHISIGIATQFPVDRTGMSIPMHRNSGDPYPTNSNENEARPQRFLQVASLMVR